MRTVLVLSLVLLACDAPSLRLPAGLGEGATRESCDPLDGLDDPLPALAKPTRVADGGYEVLPGVTLSPHVAARLARLDEEFFRRTRKHLVVVSGTRDPARQAKAMYSVIQHGGSLLKLYEDREAALEIKQAHDQAVAAGKPPAAVIAAMQAQLRAQMDRGVYISAHLRAGAVDVRNTTLSVQEKRIFRAIVQDMDGVRMLEEHHPPHIHLQIDRGTPAPGSTRARSKEPGEHEATRD